MFKNYIKVALRALKKNKLYALINILGLATGLTVFVFSNVLTDYEESHDLFFDNADRIYTVGAVFNPNLGVGISETDGAQHALGPIIKSEIAEAEAVARTIFRQFLVTVGDDNYNETVRFADTEITRIFNFEYVSGDMTALDDPTGIMLSESMAKKLFKDGSAIGKTITLDHEHDLTVTAVIKDLPKNTHFGSSFINGTSLEIVIPMPALERITEFNPDENWGNLSVGNMTYVLLPESLDGAWLLSQLKTIEETLVPADRFEVINGFTVYPIKEANLFIWRGIGLPIMMVLKLLGMLVLGVACINYANLATAQSLRRIKEVGLRKTLGAGRKQLLTQFFVESITITAIAMVVAVAIVELVIPLFNIATGKALVLDYISVLPWLLGSTLIVGVIAGAYPAYMISKTMPIEALRDTSNKGPSGNIFRSLMIGTQFFVSVLLLSMVAIVWLQNARIVESSEIYPKDTVYVLKAMNTESIEERHQTLKNEILNIPGVEGMSYSSQVPFQQNNSNITATLEPANKTNSFFMNIMRMDADYISIYNADLIAGRYSDENVGLDEYVREVNRVNVMINKLAADRFGFENPQDAIGVEFYDADDTEDTTTYTIIGVVEDQNILGLHNAIKPWMFFIWDEAYNSASIKISSEDKSTTIAAIEEAWDRVIPDYPIQGQFLDEEFQNIYAIFEVGNAVLAGFAGLALTLALFGLFGLAAFMAEQRTKEIGIRKVLGASTMQISKMLIIKFSIPVLIAAPFALGLSYFGGNAYINFFDDRISSTIGIILIAGLIGIIFAWITVASHAMRVAKRNPIQALRYE